MRFLAGGQWTEKHHPDELGYILRGGCVIPIRARDIRVGDMTRRDSEEWDGDDLVTVERVEP